MALDVTVGEIVVHPAIHALHRLGEQEQKLIDEMRSEIVQPAAALRGLPAPGPRQTVALPRHLDPANVTQQAVVDRFPQRQEIAIPAAVVEDVEHLPALTGGRDHAVGLGDGQTHHLVGDDVLAGLQRTDGQVRVRRMRRGQDHQIDLRIGDHRLETLIGTAMPFGHDLLARIGIARADTVQLEAGSNADQVTVNQLPRIAVADDDCLWFAHDNPP